MDPLLHGRLFTDDGAGIQNSELDSCNYAYGGASQGLI